MSIEHADYPSDAHDKHLLNANCLTLINRASHRDCNLNRNHILRLNAKASSYAQAQIEAGTFRLQTRLDYSSCPEREGVQLHRLAGFPRIQGS